MKIKVTLLVLSLNEYDGFKSIMPLVDREIFHQILILDGGSTDGTIELANEMGFEVYVQKQRGIRQGYAEVWPYIRGDYVLTFSPDGNSPVKDLSIIIDKVSKGYDMVIGSRYLPPAFSEDDDVITAFGNALFTKTVNFLFSSNYTDVMVLYRIFRKDLIQELDLLNKIPFKFVEKIYFTKISFEPLLSARVAKYKYKYTEIPVCEPKRIGGERKLQIIRWGLAYYTQFFLEFFGLLGRKHNLN